MTQKTIRVMIVDDHSIVRKGLRALLATERDIQVVGEASDGAEAITQAQALHPDVILMDLVMPRLDGIEATRHITLNQPVFASVDQLPPTAVFPPSRRCISYLLIPPMTCAGDPSSSSGLERWSLPLPASSRSWLIRLKSSDA
jgi:CheY-like chemotaxis protein